MKKLTSILIILVFIFTLFSCTTVKHTSIPPKKYEVSTGLNQKDNFDMVNTWIVKWFVKAENIIEYSNNETSIISGKFKIPIHAQDPNFPKYYEYLGLATIFIVVKTEDNKVSLQIEVLDIAEKGISTYKIFEKRIIDDIREYSNNF